MSQMILARRYPLASKMVWRLISLIVVLLCVSFLTFLLYYLSPGDKAMDIAHARYMGENDVPMEVIDAIRTEFGLDKPFLGQYFHWLTPILQGDFGISFVSQEPVLDIFLPNLKETLVLGFVALVIGLGLAFLLSIISVWKPGSIIDRLAIAFASIGAAIPSFWLGLMLILLFAATLNWLPSYGTGTFAHLILPAATLSVWVTTSQTRLLRSFLLEAKAAPHLEALRLRGVSEREIFWRHVMRHAMVPAVTMIGVDLAGVLEGAVIVEVIFARNGIGSLFVGAVMSRDYPIVMFLTLFFALSYVTINTSIEMFQEWLTPSRDTRATIHAQRLPGGAS